MQITQDDDDKFFVFLRVAYLIRCVVEYYLPNARNVIFNDCDERLRLVYNTFTIPSEAEVQYVFIIVC